MDDPGMLLHLGDPRATMPLGAALLASMLAARAWRMALCWALLLGTGLALVALSKIVFLGWGGGLPLLGFKALSGHATGASAVYPMLFWMLARGRADAGAAPARRLGLDLGFGPAPGPGFGFGLGLGIGAVVGALLLVYQQHSLAEALAGCLLGAAIGLGSIRLGAAGMPALSWQGLLVATLTLCAAAWLMQWAPLGYWMIRAARLLSGNTEVYPL
jgi:hypothetical protein